MVLGMETTHMTTAPENTVITIRPSRTFESFSRGLELVRAVQGLWKANDETGYGYGLAGVKLARIRALCDDFGLTIAEWHYWCRQAAI